jgi:hypothetical protein
MHERQPMSCRVKGLNLKKSFQLDFCTVGYLGRNYMQSATHISIRLPECVVIRRPLKRSQAATASR